MYLQKKGICIGSCVAPLLCDIFLSEVDQNIDNCLMGTPVLKVFRYVDNFLIVMNHTCSFNVSEVDKVLDVFKANGKGLTFTHENPIGNSIQFLDLRVTFQSIMFAGAIYQEQKKNCCRTSLPTPSW